MMYYYQRSLSYRLEGLLNIVLTAATRWCKWGNRSFVRSFNARCQFYNRVLNTTARWRCVKVLFSFLLHIYKFFSLPTRTRPMLITWSVIWYFVFQRNQHLFCCLNKSGKKSEFWFGWRLLHDAHEFLLSTSNWIVSSNLFHLFQPAFNQRWISKDTHHNCNGNSISFNKSYTNRSKINLSCGRARAKETIHYFLIINSEAVAQNCRVYLIVDKSTKTSLFFESRKLPLFPSDYRARWIFQIRFYFEKEDINFFGFKGLN